MVEFLNISEEEFLKKKNIYKYITLENMLNSLDTNELWFSNPVFWPDPFEKRFIEATFNVGGEKKEFYFIDRIYCSCFTQLYESEAQWSAYSKGNICIKLTFNRKKLLEILKTQSEYDVYIGNVRYERIKEIKGDTEKLLGIKYKDNKKKYSLNLMLIKRRPFMYEEEIRIILIKKAKTQEKGVKLKLKNLPENLKTVTISPTVGAKTEAMLKSVFKDKYNLKNIITSRLYKPRKKAVIKL